MKLSTGSYLLTLHVLASIVYAGSTLEMGCQIINWSSLLLHDESVQDVCCPPSDLQPPFKVNQVHIGLSGWTIDPEVEGLMEFFEATAHERECNSTVLPRQVAGERWLLS